MSFKLNQADPTRRARLLARRAGRLGSLMAGGERDSRGCLISPRDRTRPPAYSSMATPMKISRRRAMTDYMRRPYMAELAKLKAAIKKAGKDCAEPPPFPKHLELLERRCHFVMTGQASRKYGYGFHPNKENWYGE